MEAKLYVGNLAYETSEEDLRALFAQAGTVASVALIKDRATGESKGFAFVEMTTAAEAQKAINLFNGYSLDNRELRVNVAKPKSASSGFQSPNKTFSVAGRSAKVNASKQPKTSGGYQSTLGAFGKAGSPVSPRRRGGNQHY